MFAGGGAVTWFFIWKLTISNSSTSDRFITTAEKIYLSEVTKSGDASLDKVMLIIIKLFNINIFYLGTCKIIQIPKSFYALLSILTIKYSSFILDSLNLHLEIITAR